MIKSLKNCKIIHWLILAHVCVGLLAFAQTPAFSVTARTTNPSNGLFNLDSTMTVTYTVALSGGVNLTNVVPYLEVDSTNVELLSTFIPTWNGLTAIATWNSGTSQSLAFSLHMYNNSTLCDTPVQFKLRFMSDQISSPIQATVSNPSGAMQFTVTSSQTMRLEKRLSRLSDPKTFSFGHSGSMFFIPDTSIPRSEIQNPSKRVVLYANWDFNGADLDDAFVALSHKLAPTNCSWNMVTNLWPNYQNYRYTGTVVDQTVTPNVTVVQDSITNGVNIFDVSDASACGVRLQDAINFNASGVLWDMFYIFDFTLSFINKLDLYLASTGECSASQTNFGTPPDASEFHIGNFYLSSDGRVKAALTVPDAWKSGNQLATGFAVSWFLRTNSRVINLNLSGRSLSLDTAIDLSILNPEDYFLEARVTRTQTGSSHTVSTSNAGETNQVAHSLTEQNFTFQNLESGFPIPNGALTADNSLDPGELLTYSMQVESGNGAAMPAMTFVPGYEVNSTRGTLVDIAQNNLVGNTSGQTLATLIGSMTLIEADPMTNVNFYIDFYLSPVTQSSVPLYRRYFNLREVLGARADLNAQDTFASQEFDFSAGTQGWTIDNQTQHTGVGWAYDAMNGYFEGDGGTLEAQKTDLYSLLSPNLEIGSSGAVLFSHHPQFTFIQSGGLLEYRIIHNGTPGAWSNFISATGDCPTCQSCATYSGCFPNSYNTANFTAYLTDKQVWMRDELQSVLVSKTVPSSILASEGDDIQFRFLFQDPSLSVNGTPRSNGSTRWVIDSFTYQNVTFQGDNLFGVDLDNLNWGCATSRALSISGTVPVNQIGVEWYESRESLITGGQTPVLGAVNLPFSPEEPGTYTYYARLSNGNTKRIVKVTLTVEEGCACFNTVDDAVNAMEQSLPNWPNSNSLLDFVLILNNICP